MRSPGDTSRARSSERRRRGRGPAEPRLHETDVARWRALIAAREGRPLPPAPEHHGSPSSQKPASSPRPLPRFSPPSAVTGAPPLGASPPASARPRSSRSHAGASATAATPSARFTPRPADVAALATLTAEDLRRSGAGSSSGAGAFSESVENVVLHSCIAEATSEAFRARVERELAEQRERAALRRGEHRELTERAATLREAVARLETENQRDVAGEAERRAVAESLYEAEAARLPSGAKLPTLPKRVGYSSPAVIDAASQAKIEQLHQIIAHMATEQQGLRTRLNAAEYESGERAERIAELESKVASLQAQLDAEQAKQARAALLDEMRGGSGGKSPPLTPKSSA